MNKLYLLFFIFGFSNAVLAGALVEFEKPLTLRAQAEVSTQTVCLQDVVDEAWIKSRCTLDKAACCRWNLGGQNSKNFSRVEILKELSGIQFPGYKLSLNNGAEVVQVTQTKRAVSNAEIAERLVVAVQKKFNIEQDVNVRAIEVTHPIYVPLQSTNEDWNLEVISEVGQNLIRVRLNSKGESQAGSANAEVYVSNSSYVAKRTVRSTEELLPADFELKKIDLALGEFLRTRSFQQLGEFPAASRTRVTVAAGSPLVVSAIEKTPAVRSGETVTLMIRSDSVKISTKGVVQTTASVGDTVSVAVPKYSKTFRGKLVDGKMVEVWL